MTADSEATPAELSFGQLPVDSSVSRVLAALLSACVPGLGQAYLGQWWRGAELFVTSALMCFGFGFCNLAVAVDAWSLAGLRHEEAIYTHWVSPVWRRARFLYLIFRGIWWIVTLPFTLLAEFLREVPPFNTLVIAYEALKYGKGGRAR